MLHWSKKNTMACTEKRIDSSAPRSPRREQVLLRLEEYYVTGKTYLEKTI
jgi:hypothetical protein